MPDTDKPAKMDTRNQRSYTFVFDEVGDKEKWLAYAQRVHRMKLPQLLQKLLEADAAKNEPSGPPAS
ncbi:hypothetical protein [Hymenobacter fodinae]|uniref:Uncharacterized protein n=1 Tax=Hymenobacter fodinae TaxID=2510796 RepID=A0A4Z0P3P6_9BACT|nr:hypothetical protein [Hymenobacter fodinae]TGE05578.1 hypothetical protein EU556_19960 [Hymenobacter fodinae]